MGKKEEREIYDCSDRRSNISFVCDYPGKTNPECTGLSDTDGTCRSCDQPFYKRKTDFMGEMYTIACSGDAVYLGKDLPDEYASSEDTYSLKGTLAKAKANAAQGLGTMIEIATEGEHTPNRKEKNNIDAASGWYKYTTRFALPVYGQDGDVERYNVFRGFMIIRHDQDGMSIGISKIITSNPRQLEERQ